jgi:hypothetical protein
MKRVTSASDGSAAVPSAQGPNPSVSPKRMLSRTYPFPQIFCPISPELTSMAALHSVCSRFSCKLARPSMKLRENASWALRPRASERRRGGGSALPLVRLPSPLSDSPSGRVVGGSSRKNDRAVLSSLGLFVVCSLLQGRDLYFTHIYFRFMPRVVKEKSSL